MLQSIKDIFSSDDAKLHRGTANKYISNPNSLNNDDLINRIGDALSEIYTEGDIYGVVVINPYSPSEYGKDYGSFVVIGDVENPDEAKEIISELDPEVINNCKILCVKANNTDWEPKSDKEYYGEIPVNVTVEKLVDIMVNGLYNFVLDSRAHNQSKGQIGNAQRLSEDLLGLWLEHDSLDDQKFDHLITEDIIDDFMNNVSNSLILKDPSLK